MSLPTKEKYHQLLYEEIPAVCLMLDQHLVIQDINRYGCEQLGYQSDELIGMPVGNLSVPEEREFLDQKLRECLFLSGEPRRWECMRLRKDGSRYWVRDTVRVIEAEGAPLVVIACEDMTETHYLINELERLSTIDSLTGLYSRRKFDRHLDELLFSMQGESKGQLHVLFFIDLDQFKMVNDSCGHICGDELLRQITQLLKQQIRGQDVLARLGGDEFGLILESCTLDEALAVGEKILSAINHFHFSWENHLFTVGASIGGIVIDGPGYTVETLLHLADTACYAAKDKGRNRIQMYDIGDQELKRRGRLQQWITQLNQALDDDRFLLYQQPILPITPHLMGNGQTAYHEILIRLRDPDGGIILPGAFIPAAEYYNISPRIDRWVTRTVLNRYLVNPPSQFTTCFINLSGLTLSDQQFVAEISLLMRETQNKGFRICFEITETAAIRNLNSALSFMDTFRELGCQFALDDFGSGFSSFGYLKTLPVDYIKIDGSFVKNMIQEPLDLAVVRAIHEVAEVFGKQTIAEFVENLEVLNVLKGLGIDFAQGYHIQRPAPMTEEDS